MAESLIIKVDGKFLNTTGDAVEDALVETGIGLQACEKLTCKYILPFRELGFEFRPNKRYYCGAALLEAAGIATKRPPRCPIARPERWDQDYLAELEWKFKDGNPVTILGCTTFVFPGGGEDDRWKLLKNFQ
ncbi:MAG: hypothetical protein WCJ58_02640 [bacterium]